jgi:hypothetical protein
MSRRIAISLIVILLGAVAAAVYFLHQSRLTMVADPYRFIGEDAGIIIETIDLRNLINSVTTGKGLFSEIENVKELSGFNSRLKYIADQINKPGFRKLSQEGTAVISFHSGDDGSLIPFLSKVIPAETGYRHLREAFEEAGITRITEEKTAGKRLSLIPFNVNGRTDTLFVTINSGLLVCTTSRSLATRTLTQNAAGTDIRSAPGFSRILISSGKNLDKIFVVFGNLGETLEKILPEEKSSLAARILKLGGSAGGDIFIKEDGLTISGYIESSGESERLSQFRSIEPVAFQTYRILPAATSMFETMVMTPRADHQAASAESQAAILARRLKPYLGDEITKAYIDIRNNQVSRNTLVIYKLKNRVQCENIFLEVIGDKAEKAYFKPDEQTSMPVYLTGKPGLLLELEPGFAPGFDDSSFAFYDNFMITGNSYAAISRLLYDNILNKTLANDLLYREFEKGIPSRAGYLFYCVPSRSLDYFSVFLGSELARELAANRNTLDKVQSVGYQLASVNGMIYNNLTVNYKELVMEESTTEWETLLDTTAAIKPFFFTNHNTGAKEIFIQDAGNNAYLINTAGRVLWKLPLRERIIGNVFMIDYYRNGKYQLLFAGKNNLHLIDRNGNYVDRYPVRLRSPATSPPALFDYENNGTYRIIIAGEDKLVYSYDKSGSVVKGWEPFRTAGIVTSEAGFYKVSGKDFIVVADETSVYFLDRTGKIRLTPDDAVTKADGSAMRLSSGSRPSIVCSAPDGTVQTVSFTGEVKIFNFKKFSFDHSFDFFDVDGDGFGEYVFIDSSKLYVYDNNQTEMFSKDFDSASLVGPINFTFSSSDRKIGVFDEGRNLIWLVDSKGTVMSGFPLRGASMFSIGKLSSAPGWNLIVGGDDRFLYNYKIESPAK